MSQYYEKYTRICKEGENKRGSSFMGRSVLLIVEVVKFVVYTSAQGLLGSIVHNEHAYRPTLPSLESVLGLAVNS